jgi:hypothetical protein
MSYMITVCEPPVPEDDKAAWQKESELVGQEGSVPPVFHELISRLTAKYPCICDLSDDEVDDGVWSDGPLRNNAKHKATVLGVVWSCCDEVQPFIVKTANELGLVVFDPQLNQIYRP